MSIAAIFVGAKGLLYLHCFSASDGLYYIGGAEVQSACFAVIVGVTPGKGILVAFLLPLRVAFGAHSFVVKLMCFQISFAFLVSLCEE